MKILFIHHVADVYGSSRSLLRLSSALIRDGHSVAVVLQEDGPLRVALESAGARIHLVPSLPVLHRSRLTRPTQWYGLLRDVVRSRKALIGIMTRERPNLVHTNTATILPVSGWCARSLGIPNIQHIRESFLDFGPLWPLYRSLLLANCDRVLSISQFLANMFAEKQRNERITVIHNGLSREEFEHVPADEVRRFRESFKLGPLVVGLIGRIKLVRKGQEVFVKAAALLKDEFPDAQFVLVGSPFPGNESHLDTLRRMINDLGLGDRVIFAGHMSDTRIALQTFDVSVMASAQPEPLGNVTIESMAMGKPVVGTRIGGTPELVVEGETGFLVPPHDAEAMAGAIGKLLRDPGLRESMGRAGREHFLQQLEFAPFYKGILASYASVVRSAKT